MKCFWFVARRQPKADMFSVSHFFQKSTVARGPRTGLFSRKNESIEFSECKFEI